MWTESMARKLGVRLDAVELLVEDDAAVGIIGREGWRK